MRRASACKCSPRRHALLSPQVRAAQKADRAAGLKPRSVADALSVLERPNLGSRTSSLRRSLNTALGAAGDAGAGTNGSPTRRSSSAGSHRSSLSALMDQFVSPTKAPGTTLRVSGAVSGAPTGLAAVYAEREAADLLMTERQAALLNVRVGPPVVEPTPVVTPQPM